MTAESGPKPGDAGPAYELRVAGELSDQVVEQLGAVRRKPTTTLVVPAIDRAFLHGVIRRLEDLGLELVSVHEVPGGSASRDITRSR